MKASIALPGRRSAIGVCLTAVLSVVLALSIAAAAQAQGLRTLTGETLLAHNEIPDTSSEIVGVCNPLGTSTFAFSVTGVVTSGPYEGRFTESGSFAMGPFTTDANGNTSAQPISFESTFTIEGTHATITGTKTLSSEPLEFGNFAICGPILTPLGFPGLPPLPDNAAYIQARVNYEANVLIGNGHASFLDSGTAMLDYADLGIRNAPFGTMQFVEVFESDQQAPRPETG